MNIRNFENKISQVHNTVLLDYRTTLVYKKKLYMYKTSIYSNV